MTHKTENYNLLVEDWIPILWADGRPDRVGIRTALTEAGRIRQIAASNPMDRVALLRLLLAVLQWCKPTLMDEERRDLETKEGIHGNWLERLGTQDELYKGFNLLGETAYNQVLPSDTKTSPGINVLLQEAPSGTNKAHFRHLYDRRTQLCLACCALGLARLPAFTTSKGKGNFPGINQVPPIYFLPHGETILQTLLFSWPSQVFPYDLPAWDSQASMMSEEEHVGVLEGFTWIPRRVRIARPTAKDFCVWCGKYDFVCTEIAFRPPLKEDVEKIKGRLLKKRWRDPHVAYLKDPEKSKSGDSVNTGSAKASDCLNDPWSAAGEWRQLWFTICDQTVDPYIGAPLWLKEAQKKAKPQGLIETEAVGFSTDGKANYFDVWRNSLQLSPKIFRDTSASEIVRKEISWVAALIEKTIDARTASWKEPVKKLRGATFLARTSPPNRKKHELRAAMCQIRQQAELLLQEEFLAFLDAIKLLPSTGWEDARKEWRRRVAKILSCQLRLTIAGSTPGSPLPRHAAMEQVDEAILEAIRQVELEENKASANPKRGDRKRGEA